MRAILEQNQYGREKVTWVGNDKVVLLHADVAPEDQELLKKWQEEKLVPCVLVLGDNAKAIICDKSRFYLNEEDYIFRESEREKLLEQIRNNCSDPITSSALDDLILKIRAERGTTFVVVTHELPSIFKIADRCAMFDKARHGMIALAPPAVLRDSTDDGFVKEFFSR